MTPPERELVAGWLAVLPEVTWDRLVEAGGVVRVYGWVGRSDESIVDSPDQGRFLPPLRITPAGLRALADATEMGVIEPVTLRRATEEADRAS